jgi:hypothetical protein
LGWPSAGVRSSVVRLPPTVHSSLDHHGFLGAIVGLDNPTLSKQTQELLGWQPTHPGLIDDLGKGHYFRNPS